MKRNPVEEARGGGWFYPKPSPPMSIQATCDVTSGSNGFRLVCDEKWEGWRGSFYSDDDEIIRLNLKRSYLDPKGFNKPLLGFRLAHDEEKP